MSSSDDDARFMRRCLSLARRAEGRTAPNPIVGCVIVKAGKVLAEGVHRRAGGPHAEAVALAKLGNRAPGATLYVNLEPCAHVGNRRTEPCAPLLATSGIGRLVFGMRDPFPGHGGGLARLRRAKIAVEGPVLEDECARANEVFVIYAQKKRAHFTLKAAMSMDGKIATASGQSRWITGEQARLDGHRRRNRVAAILVGIGTLLADDPKLTTRGVRGGQSAVPVIIDGRLRIVPSAQVFKNHDRVIVATSKNHSARRVHALEQVGAEVWTLPGKQGRVNLLALAKKLAKAELTSVLVEGGAQIHGAFLRAKLCDRLLLYVAPIAVGGAGAPGWFGGEGVLRLAGAHRFVFAGAPRRLGDDFLLEATLRAR